MLFDKVVCISKWSLEARILVFLAQAQKWPVFNCARLRIRIHDALLNIDKRIPGHDAAKSSRREAFSPLVVFPKVRGPRQCPMVFLA
jgi:hypothetical protein